VDLKNWDTTKTHLVFPPQSLLNGAYLITVEVYVDVDGKRLRNVDKVKLGTNCMSFSQKMWQKNTLFHAGIHIHDMGQAKDYSCRWFTKE